MATVVLVGTTSSFTQKITILAVGFGLRPTVFLILNLYPFNSIIFVLLMALFYYINYNAHKLYLEKEEKEILEEEIKEEKEEYRFKRKNKKIIILYWIYLILIAVALYVIGELLSKSLTNLSNIFGLPELVLGILLGVITSIPELITFIEAQRKEKNKNSITILGERIDGLVYGEGNKITKENAIIEYAEEIIGKECNFLYWGDLDFMGIDMFERVKKQNKGANIKLFSQIYESMIKLSDENKIQRIHNLQNKNIDLEDFCKNFNLEKTVEKIKKILNNEGYIPQEILNYEELLKISK